MKEREKFGSRLGFILISAGCAIGLGNVWKFPYIVGKYGGAAFVLIYLAFLAILGLPIMVMEFSVGRASRKSIARSFHELEPNMILVDKFSNKPQHELKQEPTKWHLYSGFGIAGNYLLMMFYTTVAGWMLSYFVNTAKGDFVGKTVDEVGAAFGGMLSDPVTMGIYMVVVVLLGMAVCVGGLKNGVEKITKPVMLGLLGLLLLLAVRSCTLDGGQEGLAFYLIPNFDVFNQYPAGEIIFAAMGQAFFTLSLGIGAMAIFGSYIDKKRTLLGEAISVTVLDTFVAFTAGLIIFPACSAFGFTPDQGPGLIFITLPNVFNEMAGGQLWGSLFFLFMSFAAMSTVIGVFENIISCTMDSRGWSRKKAVIVNLVVIMILSIPCVLGYNLWSDFQPLKEGFAVLDLEDFIVSQNLLPLGSLFYLIFCTNRYGWGWENFTKEANLGTGMKFPNAIRFYCTWIVPALVIYVFIMGYIGIFG